MFRPMRRMRQQLPDAVSRRLLREATHGVLALPGEDGYPYAVPVSHVYEDGHIYFHCARSGHKWDALRPGPRVCFCVVAEDTVIPEKRTTAYVSVIAFGRARIVETEEEMRHICTLIGEKFSPGGEEACAQETEEALAAACLGCVDITVEHLTGKCGKELLSRFEGMAE